MLSKSVTVLVVSDSAGSRRQQSESSKVKGYAVESEFPYGSPNGCFRDDMDTPTPRLQVLFMVHHKYTYIQAIDLQLSSDLTFFRGSCIMRTWPRLSKLAKAFPGLWSKQPSTTLARGKRQIRVAAKLLPHIFFLALPHS